MGLRKMIYYVNTNTGYCGTDDMLEIEAETESEAWEEAHQQLIENLSIDVYETLEEAEENA